MERNKVDQSRVELRQRQNQIQFQKNITESIGDLLQFAFILSFIRSFFCRYFNHQVNFVCFIVKHSVHIVISIRHSLRYRLACKLLFYFDVFRCLHVLSLKSVRTQLGRDHSLIFCYPQSFCVPSILFCVPGKIFLYHFVIISYAIVSYSCMLSPSMFFLFLQ